MREAIAGVTENVSALRGILVRTVRTSTAEANRRMFERYEVDLRGRLADGTDVDVVDISEQGARLCGPGAARLHVGALNRLTVPGYPGSLEFEVRAVNGEEAHVKLTEASVSDQWRAFVEHCGAPHQTNPLRLAA